MKDETFRTVFPVESPGLRLTPRSRAVALGSCFAHAIGDKMRSAKLDVLVNPFGTLFGPLAIARLVRGALGKVDPDPGLFLERDGSWLTFEAHSEVRGVTPADLTREFNERRDRLATALAEADVLLITLGSAWAHELVDSGAAVANNHRQPAARFRRYLLSAEWICDELDEMQQALRQWNPRLSIVYSVSPVRHGRTGMVENSVSKAVLRVAVHQLTTSGDASYFPAYELLLDDLRDYRFYGEDRLHPSPEAERYIFSRWLEACGTPELEERLREWEEIHAALAHRATYPASPAYRDQLLRLRTRLEKLATSQDVADELAQVSRRLGEGT